MRKNTYNKSLIIIALVFAVIGISIGFAAFSNILNIESSALVKPDKSKFDVNFSSTDGVETDGKVVGIPSTDLVTADDATIDNSTDSPTIKGLKANFTEPGQNVIYSFYAHNKGEYIAYLNSITFDNVSGTNLVKTCTAESGTTQALVDVACNDITIAVTVGTDTFTTNDDSIANHSLLLDQYEPVIVTISYNTNTNINIADGDFNVKFGNISLVYGSVD